MALLESDPLDLKLDTDGDILIDGDGLQLVSGLEGVAQLCQIALRLFKGEWFLNLDKGMPWFQEILGEKFDEGLIRHRVTDVLLAVPGVKSIATLSVTQSGPDILITSSVTTAFGDTEPDTLNLSGGS